MSPPSTPQKQSARSRQDLSPAQSHEAVEASLRVSPLKDIFTVHERLSLRRANSVNTMPPRTPPKKESTRAPISNSPLARLDERRTFSPPTTPTRPSNRPMGPRPMTPSLHRSATLRNHFSPVRQADATDPFLPTDGLQRSATVNESPSRMTRKDDTSWLSPGALQRQESTYKSRSPFDRRDERRGMAANGSPQRRDTTAYSRSPSDRRDERKKMAASNSPERSEVDYSRSPFDDPEKVAGSSSPVRSEAASYLRSHSNSSDSPNKMARSTWLQRQGSLLRTASPALQSVHETSYDHADSTSPQRQDTRLDSPFTPPTRASRFKPPPPGPDTPPPLSISPHKSPTKPQTPSSSLSPERRPESLSRTRSRTTFHASSPALPPSPERHTFPSPTPKPSTIPVSIKRVPIASMSANPTLYPGCPIHMSPKLLNLLITAIHNHKAIESLNCDWGIFEDCLIQMNESGARPDLPLTGWVEADSEDPNPPFLGCGNVRRISRNVEWRRKSDKRYWTGQADCLVFVCRGDVGEMKERLEDFEGKRYLGKEKGMWTVVWVGKESSWREGFEMVIRAWARDARGVVEIGKGGEAGLGESEMLVIVKKRAGTA